MLRARVVVLVGACALALAQGFMHVKHARLAAEEEQVPRWEHVGDHKVGAFRLDGRAVMVARRGLSFRVGFSSPPTFHFRACGVYGEDAALYSGCGVEQDTVVQFPTQHGADHVVVALPENTPVGTYVGRAGGQELEFVVLFNPYCGSCQEGGLSPRELAEFLESERTMIWQGTADKHSGNVWGLLQFDGWALRTSLGLLARLPMELRAHPHAVARHLTNEIYNRVCYDRWYSDDYQKGPRDGYRCGAGVNRCSDPSDWTNSLDILRQHMERVEQRQKRIRIQYCQCFVFAGVTASVTRSLGLASRVITNFNSAHDTESKRAVAMFFTMDAKENLVLAEDDEIGDHPSAGDSVWGFHAWNEVYFKRPDIRRGGDGWQVIDSTPQEFSHGIFQNGPAPLAQVKANKDGCYDNEFIISEVKANVMFFVRPATADRDTPFELYETYERDPFDDAMTPGMLVVTAAVGCDVTRKDANTRCLEDVTGSYKAGDSPGKATAPKKRPRCAIVHGSGSAPTVPVGTKDLEEDRGSGWPPVARTAHAQSTTPATAFQHHHHRAVHPNFVVGDDATTLVTAHTARVGHGPVPSKREVDTALRAFRRAALEEQGDAMEVDEEVPATYATYEPSSPFHPSSPFQKHTTGVWTGPPPVSVEVVFTPQRIGERAGFGIRLVNRLDREVDATYHLEVRPLDYRGSPVVYKTLRTRRVFAKAATMSKDVRLPPLHYHESLGEYTVDARALMELGVDPKTTSAMQLSVGVRSRGVNFVGVYRSYLVL